MLFQCSPIPFVSNSYLGAADADLTHSRHLRIRGKEGRCMVEEGLLLNAAFETISRALKEQLQGSVVVTSKRSIAEHKRLRENQKCSCALCKIEAKFLIF